MFKANVSLVKKLRGAAAEVPCFALRVNKKAAVDMSAVDSVVEDVPDDAESDEPVVDDGELILGGASFAWSCVPPAPLSGPRICICFA